LDLAVAAVAGVSRERAQALILAGHVRVAGETTRKPSASVPADAAVEVTADQRFVSRGALKLQHALDTFDWPVASLRCLDVGASTGGFTDCLLQRGAASVTAVDVGYGHLAWRLRNDPRVTAFERTNFRHADLGKLGGPFAFVSADVSFISLAKLTPQFAQALEPGGHIVALIKPQFEAGRAAVGRGGVVREPAAQAQAIKNVVAAFEAVGIRCRRLAYSPIKGPAGNIEFLLGGVKAADAAAVDLQIEGVVRTAHEALDR